MARKIVFIVVSLALLLLDRQLERHGVTSVPKWLIIGLWVVIALWARIPDDDAVASPRTQRAVRIVLLPVAGVGAVSAGALIWSIHAGLAGLAAIVMITGAALLAWWLLELIAGAR